MEKIQLSPKRIVREVVIASMIFGLVYFGNQAVQSWLGQRAIDNSGIEHLAFDEALDLSEMQEKPVLAVFGALWCPPCRKLDKEVFSDPQVQTTIHSDFAFTRLNHDSEDRIWFQKYGVDRFPTLIAIDGNGNEISRLKTTYDPEVFNRQLASLSAYAADVARYKQSPE